jgi:hypothetical protein
MEPEGLDIDLGPAGKIVAPCFPLERGILVDGLVAGCPIGSLTERLTGSVVGWLFD